MLLLALCNPSLHLPMSTYSLLPSSPQNDAYAQALFFFPLPQISTSFLPSKYFWSSHHLQHRTTLYFYHAVFNLTIYSFLFVWSVTSREKTFPLMDMVSIQSQKNVRFCSCLSWSLLTTIPQPVPIKSSLSTALAQDGL